jgi:hypothetical protein
MATTTKSRKLPLIGWKACEERFYLDGLPITEKEAIRHWREGTAKFLNFASERIAFLKSQKLL